MLWAFFVFTWTQHKNFGKLCKREREDEQVRITIVGGGAMGLLYAAKLASVQTASVTLITRTEEQAQRIRQEGIRLGDSHHRVSQCLSAQTMEAVPCERSACAEPDGVLLMTKQQHLNAELLPLLRSVTGRGTLIGFQNGLGHIEKLSASIPRHQLAAAVSTEGAVKVSLNEVQHRGSGVTRLGAVEAEACHKDRRKTLVRLAQCLEKAGFETLLSKKIEADIWNKVLMNAVINPLTALLKVNNGDLLFSSEWQKLMRKLLDEGCEAAKAEGIALSPRLWEDLIDLCERTGQNRSSMLQDVIAGRETELDWITGGLLRIADKHQLALPAHWTVYQLLQGSSQF